MELKKFIENFAEQFEETDIADFTSDTIFRNLDEWSSMTGLAVMAMIDDEYDVQIKADDLRSSKTIQELFDLVNSKL